MTKSRNNEGVSNQIDKRGPDAMTDAANVVLNGEDSDWDNMRIGDVADNYSDGEESEYEHTPVAPPLRAIKDDVSRLPEQRIKNDPDEIKSVESKCGKLIADLHAARLLIKRSRLLFLGWGDGGAGTERRGVQRRRRSPRKENNS